MSSILKVDQLQDSGGNAIITSDGAGSITTPGITTGKVLQVVQTVNTTERTTTSTSFVDVTGLSVNITPSSTSNKILILCNYVGESTTADASSNYTILRDSTNLANSYFNTIYSSATFSSSPCSICFLDSPSTTSATTYKLQFKRSNSAGGITKVLSMDSTITVMEIGA